MVGDSLAFSAYTSATDRGFFISDGTEAGTVEIGTEQPYSYISIDNRLIYANSTGLHSVDSSDGNSLVVINLIEGFNDLQYDKDQGFLLNDNILYATDASAEQMVSLVSNIFSFKVVAENAIYAIQEEEGVKSLWFTDGTVDGTYHVDHLDDSVNYYNLYEAVGIKTAGMWDDVIL